jgi:hypothetical protein
LNLCTSTISAALGLRIHLHGSTCLNSSDFVAILALQEETIFSVGIGFTLANVVCLCPIKQMRSTGLCGPFATQIYPVYGSDRGPNSEGIQIIKVYVQNLELRTG